MFLLPGDIFLFLLPGDIFCFFFQVFFLPGDINKENAQDVKLNIKFIVARCFFCRYNLIVQKVTTASGVEEVTHWLAVR